MVLDEDQQKIVVGLSHIWKYPPLFIQRAYEQLLFTKDDLSSAPREEEPTGMSSYTLKELCSRELEDDAERHDFPVKYSFHHAKAENPHNPMSELQQLLKVDTPTITKKMKKYLRALTILEYEHDHGSLSDQDYNVSMIGETVWTPSEKKRFFIALDRCGKGNIKEITHRVGPTKTVTEIYDYLNILALAAKRLPDETIEHPFAREMSNTFILQEEHLGKELNKAIEVETYKNHLKLCSTQELQTSIEFFDVWNLSSLTRLYSKTNDMTLLCSTTFNFYQLVKKFIQDIMIDLHTHQLTRQDKTVTTSLVNFMIAKRNKQKDKRLAHLDILSAIEKKRLTRKNRFPGHRSISYYAKRRRLNRGNYQPYPDEFIVGNQEKEKDNKSGDDAIFISDDDEEEEEEEKDPMLEEIDTEDELQQEVVVRDHDYEHEENVKEHLEKTLLEETITFNDNNNNNITVIEEQDEKDEKEMKKQDVLDEQKMLEYLGFNTKEEIVLASTRPLADRSNRLFYHTLRNKI